MEIRWLRPLFVNAAGFEVTVGVASGDGDQWFLRDRDGQPVLAENDVRVLLPLMQPGYGGAYDVARDMLAKRIADAELPPLLVESFPFYLPVAGADQAQSASWQKLAADWRPYTREAYVAAGLRRQLERLRRGDTTPVALPPPRDERRRLLVELWRYFGVHTATPAWSSGLVNAAVRWTTADGPPRRAWLALFSSLRSVEANVLHWNLMEALWASTRGMGLEESLEARPPQELSGSLNVAQSLLVLRFLPLREPYGNTVRATLDGYALPEEVDGERYSYRFLPAELLA